MSRDAVIVGGGAMGSSAAYHLLALDPSMAVTVVERDPTYQRASTVLSDGNVRVQFNLEENISTSKRTSSCRSTQWSYSTTLQTRWQWGSAGPTHRHGARATFSWPMPKLGRWHAASTGPRRKRLLARCR